VLYFLKYFYENTKNFVIWSLNILYWK
jgi:hypothetical protein